jgi:hypothetical protein
MSKLLAILVAFLLPLAACRDSTGPTGIDGEYTLVAINTQALPVTIFASNAGRIDITGSTLVLRSDLSFTETINYRVIPAAPEAAFDDVTLQNGTYKVEGRTVTFTQRRSDGVELGTYAGTVEGNTLTYHRFDGFDGNSYAYRK